MKAPVALLAASLLAGCSAPQAGSSADAVSLSPKSAPSSNPGDVAESNALIEQIRSGRFQADAALHKLTQAVDLAHEAAQKAGPNFAESIRDLEAVLDDAGSTLAEQTGGELPPPEEIRSRLDEFKKQRESLITTLNDLLHDLREQEPVASDLAESGPAPAKPVGKKLHGLISQAIEDIVAAIEALGGKVEGMEDVPDTGDHAPPGYGAR